MQEEICDTAGCNNNADYYDAYGNAVCGDCVKEEITSENNLSWNDFDRI